jgi:hypothetical protein
VKSEDSDEVGRLSNSDSAIEIGTNKISIVIEKLRRCSFEIIPLSNSERGEVHHLWGFEDSQTAEQDRNCQYRNYEVLVAIYVV